MKVFAEDNSNVVKMMDFVFDGVENIVRSREIVGEQDFFFFSQDVKKLLFRMLNTDL